MKNIILVIKGFVMGIANIIPGVSGGTLALTLGIYEKFINAISHFFKNFKENLKFLIPIFIGIVLSILTMSNVISYSFNHFALGTTLLFMGLVLGGIPMLLNKVKGTKEVKNLLSYVIFIITFALVMVLAFSDEIFGAGLSSVTLNMSLSGLLMMFIVGVIAASTMIIPGVSGSLVLMLLGYYTPIIEAIKEFTHFENFAINFLNLGFFGVGVLVGIVLVAKLIEWLLKKYETKTYFGVLGFIVASIIAIPVSVVHEYGMFSFNIISIIMGILLFVLGSFIGYKLGEK